MSVDETREWPRSMIESPDDASADFILELEGRVIGKVGFFRLPEIGFILHAACWGRGLAREALTAVLDHVFATRAIEAAEADVDPRNEASLGLLARLGFEQTGRAERTWCVGGAWTDSVYLSLPRGRHRTRRPATREIGAAAMTIGDGDFREGRRSMTSRSRART